jgi:mannosyltransferase
VLVGVAAALRFTTLGWQSFWLDEANTVYVVAPASLGEMFERAVQQETTPPLYYLLAWLWSQVFGTGEWGLRSLSALLGLAAVPVTFAAARHMIGTRPAFVAAALVACNRSWCGTRRRRAPTRCSCSSAP